VKILLRLLKEQVSLGWLALLAILLGGLTLASNMGLLSLAAYLIAAAAVVPLLVLLAVPIFFVQLMGIIRPVARYAERCLSHDVTFRLLAKLRTRVYASLEPLAPALLLHYRTGDLLTRLVADIDELQNVYLRIVSPIAVAGVIILLTFVIFWHFSLLLAWVALAFLLLAAVGVPLLSWWLARGIGERHLTIRAEQKAMLVDGVQGAQDLLAYGQSQAYFQKLGGLDSRIGTLQRRMALLSGLQEALNDLLKNGAMLCLLALAIPLIALRQIDAIYLGCLSLLVLAAFEVVQPLGQAGQFLGHSLAAGRRLFSLMDTPPSVEDPPVPVGLPPLDAATGYELAFEKIRFSYDPTEPSALKQITLRVRPGTRVAIVGTSGSGKSTLLRLALRYWDPDEGRIMLNGVDIRHLALADLRSVMGVVTQETYLFNTTLQANLLMARPDASEADILRVLEQARLGEFVRQLPKGLNTRVGEQGLRLSGGERQRLAIARALLKDAPLLLLDEITANLDPVTEKEVIAALQTLVQGRTTLLITHRLVAMEQMDEIVVLEDGEIKEQGTHAQLIARQGRYTQLFTIQQSILALEEKGSVYQEMHSVL
jgi:ATP-binding cassette subfamily C protein CydC